MHRCFPVLLFPVILLACSNRETTSTVEIIDGVRFVHNLEPLWGADPDIGLEFIQTIGQAETDDDRYLLYFPVDGAADNEGNIYILDSRRPAIRKYDSAGIHIADFGGKGSGPGEFRSSLCLDTDGEFNLYLSDMDNARINVFNSDGSFNRMVALGNFFHFFCVLSTGQIAGFDLSREEDPPKVARLLDRKGNMISTFGESKPAEDSMMAFLMNQCNIESDSVDDIYVSFNHFNRIEKFAPDGSLLMHIDRPLNFDVEHKARTSTYESGGELREYADPLLTYVSDRIGVDGQDRLWVLSFNAQPNETGSASSVFEDHTILQFDIFDREGVLLCRIPVPLPMSRFRVYGDQLLLIDPYQNVCIHKYRIAG